MNATLAIVLLAAPLPSVKAVSGEMICRVQHAIRHRNLAWDAGMCAKVAAAMNNTFNPELIFAMAVNESDLREFVIRKARRGVYDAGLLAVRCQLSANRCTNWPVRGLTLQELLDPEVNIRAAVTILERKQQHSPRYYLRHYNGGTVEHGYAERVHATCAAFHGRRVALRLTNDDRVRRAMNKRLGLIVEALESSP